MEKPLLGTDWIIWMLVDAILKRDFPLVQGAVVFVATCYVLFNITVDVAHSLLDPRIKTRAGF